MDFRTANKHDLQQVLVIRVSSGAKSYLGLSESSVVGSAGTRTHKLHMTRARPKRTS